MMKIVYCLNSVSCLGGIEKVTIVKANALAEIPGNEVFIVVKNLSGDFRIAEISSKVHVVNLGVISRTAKTYIHLMINVLDDLRRYNRRLKKALNEIQPDIVVSTGQSERYKLPSIKGKWKTIRELHFVRSFFYNRIEVKNIGDKVWHYFMTMFVDNYDFGHKIWKYDRIVLLTEEDKKTNWPNDKRIEVIPNPQTFTSDRKSLLTAKKVVAVGRYVHQKNFTSLIQAFRLVVEKHPDWSLDIYGDGSEKMQLQSLIEEMGLESNVFLRGYTSQVREKMLEASCYVLSSLYEGFPLVLIEAMTCGLPVVSYACPCGPKDMMTDGKDGFLVPVGDERTLADRICRLIEDEELRKSMGQAAKETSEKYKLENVVQMWMDLFHRLLDDKSKN